MAVKDSSTETKQYSLSGLTPEQDEFEHEEEKLMDYSFELNNAKKDETFASGKVTAHSPVVEVFAAMANGEEISKFGKKADVAAKYIKDVAARASSGDQMAISEINEIRKFVIQPKVLQEIKLLGLFGSYKPLKWGETAQLETVTYENVMADIQGEGQDVSTGFVRKKKKPLAPVTVSGGHKVNYRELALGDMTSENELMGEVQKQIRNKAALYVIETVYKAIADAKGVKYFYEASGLSKSDVDALLTKIRRYGKPNIIGDYALLAQIIPWIGYAGTIGSNSITGVSQKLLDEIAENGIVGSYNGSILSEIPNGYDFTKLTSDGTNYETLLPAGLGFVAPTAPAGGVAPIQTFSIGGLTSFSGNSVATGEIMTRFDLSIAAGVASTDAIGIIHDTKLDNLK